MSELARSALHGAQPERTALSWQRTALASAAGAVFIARHSGQTLGVITVVLLVGMLGLSAAAFVLGRHRYDLSPGEPTLRRDGRAPFALTLALMTMAVTELLAIVLTGG